MAAKLWNWRLWAGFGLSMGALAVYIFWVNETRAVFWPALLLFVVAALHRLEQQGWIKSEWRATESGRMAKFYALTRAGRQQMEKELADWNRLSTAINMVVQEA
jgi:hypothetical protein